MVPHVTHTIRRKTTAAGSAKGKERGSPPPPALSYKDPTSPAFAISPRVSMNSTASPTQILKGACRTTSCSQQSGRRRAVHQTVSHWCTSSVLLHISLPPTLPYPTLPGTTLSSGKPPSALWALRSRYRSPLNGWRCRRSNEQQGVTRVYGPSWFMIIHFLSAIDC